MAFFQQIEEEINDIVNVKLPENAKAIGHAQSLGDLSENAEFDAAKEDREKQEKIFVNHFGLSEEYNLPMHFLEKDASDRFL